MMKEINLTLERESEPNGLRLSDHWRSIRKHLWLVVGITVFVTGLTAVYMMRQADVYESAARVRVDLEDKNPMLVLSKNDSFVFSNPVNDPVYFNRQVQILSSAPLLRRVAKRLDLEHNDSIQAQLRPSRLQRALCLIHFDSKGCEDDQL